MTSPRLPHPFPEEQVEAVTVLIIEVDVVDAEFKCHVLPPEYPGGIVVYFFQEQIETGRQQHLSTDSGQHRMAAIRTAQRCYRGTGSRFVVGQIHSDESSSDSIPKVSFQLPALPIPATPSQPPRVLDLKTIPDKSPDAKPAPLAHTQLIRERGYFNHIHHLRRPPIDWAFIARNLFHYSLPQRHIQDKSTYAKAFYFLTDHQPKLLNEGLRYLCIAGKIPACRHYSNQHEPYLLKP